MDRWQFKSTYDVTHQEENAEVVGLAQTFYSLMDVFGVETMVPQAGKHAQEKSMLSSQSQDRMIREREEPEKEDTGSSTDLIVGEDVTKDFWHIADALDDRIQTLTRINDNRVG